MSCALESNAVLFPVSLSDLLVTMRVLMLRGDSRFAGSSGVARSARLLPTGDTELTPGLVTRPERAQM